MSIFKACDVRGRYPEEIDESIAEDIGRAIGTELGSEACVLGGDARTSTPSLRSAVRRGLTDAGVDAIDIGVVPTPVAYWTRRHLPARGVVIVTASHNPPEYNGIKFMLGELAVTPEDVQRVRRRVESGDFARGEGTCETRDVRDAYLEWLRGQFGGIGRRLKVVVDAGNGVAGDWAPQAFRDAGCEVEELFCNVDGSFPDRSPNPSRAEALEAAAARVLETGADLAACFDGDADRVVFLDESGDFVPPEEALVLFAQDALRDHSGPVVYDLKCTQVVAREVEKHGGRPVMERSGHAFIKRRLLKEEALLAGEASGHFFFRELGGDDGIYAALRMGRILAQRGASLSELRATIPRYYISPDIRLQRPGGDAAEVVERVKEEFSGRPQDRTDGVRIEFENGWALVRASVTEPAVTVRVEGDTPKDLESLRERVLAAIPDSC